MYSNVRDDKLQISHKTSALDLNAQEMLTLTPCPPLPRRLAACGRNLLKAAGGGLCLHLYMHGSDHPMWSMIVRC